MFADALDVAMQFTRCTVLSAQKQNGKCVASIGAFMVVNPQGWIVTAAHILTDLINLDREVSASRQRANDQAAIEGDQSLSGGERRRRIAALPKQQPKGNIRYSALWWRPEVRQIVDINLIAGVDIGVGRLEPCGLDRAISRIQGSDQRRATGKKLVPPWVPIPRVHAII